MKNYRKPKRQYLFSVNRASPTRMGGVDGKRTHQIFLGAIIRLKGRVVFFFFCVKVTMTLEIKCILQHSEGNPVSLHQNVL